MMAKMNKWLTLSNDIQSEQPGYDWCPSYDW